MSDSIRDKIKQNINQLFVDKPASIKLVINENEDIEITYDGCFVDLMGLSFDMISGYISQICDKKYINYGLVKECITNNGTLNGILHNFVSEKSNKIEGHIFISIDKNRYIKAEYITSLLGFILMVKKFILKFCDDNNIDIKDYWDFLDYSWSEFQKGNNKDKMNVTIL